MSFSTIRGSAGIKIKKTIYGIVVILLSTLTLYAVTHASSLIRTDSGRNFNRHFTINDSIDIIPQCLTTITSSDIAMTIKSMLRQLRSVSFPVILSTSVNVNNTSSNRSRDKAALVPEPVTLLLLGSGLMGVALYRRLKKK